jgi:hypothetical protein
MRRSKKRARAENPRKASPKPDRVKSEAAPAASQAAAVNVEKEKAPMPITYQRSRNVALLKLALINRTIQE